MIREMLESQVKMYEGIGFPALIERFVLRNGKVFESQPFKGRRWKQGECYRNALVHDNLGMYVEGFGIRAGLPFPINHAWLTDENNAVIDGTWKDPQECEYMGVEFSNDEAWKEVCKNEYYGLFMNGVGMINTDLMFRKDPELKEICEQITKQKKERQYAAL